MRIDKLLLQEIQRDAEIAKIPLEKELVLFVKESNSISLSGYSPTCPMHPISVPIEKCCWELVCRFERASSKRLETVFSKSKFFQYDAVMKAYIDIAMAEYFKIIDNFPNPTFFDPVQNTAKIMILAAPWKLLIPSVAESHIKKSCEFAFQEGINSISDAIVSHYLSIVNRRIDKILEYIESNSIETS